MAKLVRERSIEALDARTKIARLDQDLAARLILHPEGAFVRSLPGMGVVPAERFIARVGDIRRLPSAAGLAPGIRQSGKEIGSCGTFGGDKALEAVFYQVAFCS